MLVPSAEMVCETPAAEEDDEDEDEGAPSTSAAWTRPGRVKGNGGKDGY